MSHNQVQSSSKGPLCWRCDRQPARGANFIPQTGSRSGDLLYSSSLWTGCRRSPGASEGGVGIGGGRQRHPVAFCLCCPSSRVCSFYEPVTQRLAGCGKLAGGAGTSRKPLHGFGKRCPAVVGLWPIAASQRHRLDAGWTAELLSQGTVSSSCLILMAHDDRIWWRSDTPFADCLPGSPCDDKGILALRLTLRAQICSPSAPGIAQMPDSHY